MPWFPIDDKFHSNPKVMAAGNAAVGLWTRLGSYCADHLTDGFIPTQVARSYGSKKEIDALLASHPPYGPMIVPADGGYRIPDYLHYNPTRDEVLANQAVKHEARVKAGQLGGYASGVARRKHTRSKPEANEEANPKQTASKTKPPPLPSPYNHPPTDVFNSVLDQAAGMVLKHREQTGWGPPGNGALTAAKSALDQGKCREWLAAGCRPYDVSQALMARLVDGPNAHPPPVDNVSDDQESDAYRIPDPATAAAVWRAARDEQTS